MNSENIKAILSGMLILPGIFLSFFGIYFPSPQSLLPPITLCIGGLVLFIGSFIKVIIFSRNAQLIGRLYNEEEIITLPLKDIKNKLIETNWNSNLFMFVTAMILATIFAGLYTLIDGDSHIFWLVPVTGGITFLFLTIDLLGVIVNDKGILLSKNVVFDGNTHFIQNNEGHGRKIDKVYLSKEKNTTYLMIQYSYPSKNSSTSFVFIPLAEEHKHLLPEIEKMWERKIDRPGEAQ